VLSLLARMVVHVYRKVHHSIVNVHRHSLVIVAKSVSLQPHRTIHVLNPLVKMAPDVFLLAVYIFVNVHLASMVLDVNLETIVCQIHVPIMVYVHKQRVATFAHVLILTLVPIVNKS